MSRSNNHQSNGDPIRSGDWRCACGQQYRVLASGSEGHMWPRNSADGFRLEPVDAHCLCGAPIARGTVICGLFGAF